MSQNYSTNCYEVSHTVDMDMTQIENNCEALRTHFSGASAPSNPTSYVDWADSANNLYKVYYGAAWQSVWDYANDRVAAGKVKTDSLATGILSTNSTGRAKMADGYVTDAKIVSMDGSKITDNTITTAKIQAAAITPAKITQGLVTLFTWNAAPTAAISFIDENSLGVIWNAATNNLAEDGATYRAFWYGYLYIPTGATTAVLNIHGKAATADGTIRMSIGGATGSGATLSAGAGFMNAHGASLDISAYAGAWRSLVLYAVTGGSGGTINLISATVQYY